MAKQKQYLSINQICATLNFSRNGTAIHGVDEAFFGELGPVVYVLIILVAYGVGIVAMVYITFRDDDDPHQHQAAVLEELRRRKADWILTLAKSNQRYIDPRPPMKQRFTDHVRDFFSRQPRSRSGNRDKLYAAVMEAVRKAHKPSISHTVNARALRQLRSGFSSSALRNLVECPSNISRRRPSWISDTYCSRKNSPMGSLTMSPTCVSTQQMSSIRIEIENAPSEIATSPLQSTESRIFFDPSAGEKLRLATIVSTNEYSNDSTTTAL